MKTPIAIILLLIVFFNVNAQQNTLPEFENEPAYSAEGGKEVTNASNLTAATIAISDKGVLSGSS